MPYLIIIIDEFTDLIATYPQRSGGFHRQAGANVQSRWHSFGLVHSKAVGGSYHRIDYKANITSRVALHVASQIDFANHH